MSRYLVAPSVLSADFSCLGAAVADIENSGSDWVHLDVMDGQFVPNLTFGSKTVKDLRPLTKLPFDVHLMTEKPEHLVPAFIDAGADYITFHIEACVHAHRLVETIRSSGRKPGISLVPSTPVALIEELLPLVDLVLVMSVNPGFGGQVLIPSSLDKIRTLARLKAERGLDYAISVDGGINFETAAAVRSAGADVLVTGSAFFSSEDRRLAVSRLRGEA